MSDNSEHDTNDGRLMLGCGGFLFLPISITSAWFLIFEAPKPQGAVEWCIRLMMEELAIGFLFFFGVGFLWAITGSAAIKRMLDVVTLRFALIWIPIAVPTFAIAAWAILGAR